MKLYATTTSERASKGQGGNEYLEIELSIDGGSQTVGYIYLNVNEDIKNHGDKQNEWLVQYTPNKDTDPDIIAQGHYTPKKTATLKGNKQKGEHMHCKNCGNDFLESRGHNCRAI